MNEKLSQLPCEITRKEITAFRIILTILLLFVTGEAVCQELLLMRSAKTLPEKGALVWESTFFTTFTHKYDFEKKRFTDLRGDNYKLTSFTMLGYGILNNLELLAQLPIHYNTSTKEGKTDTSLGVGDMSLQTRIMVCAGDKIWPAINFSAMLRFPSGDDKGNPRLGDGTIDYGFSTVVTKRAGFFIAHIKFGYIFNGRDSNNTKLGDQFLYMLKGDFILVDGNHTAMKELTLMIGINGNLKAENTDIDG
ncbi:MAG: transporter, partial [Deltaproteobacteria bacterium]|nr:transporter [Deltaproteobacteria bacterium]